MTIFNTTYDPIKLIFYSNQIQGQNYLDNRRTFIPASNASYYTNFISLPTSAHITTGVWYSDTGSNSIAVSGRENRYFCNKGQIILPFTGTNISARIETDFGYGSATVYIDGVKPSTISGLTTYSDTLNCDATSYNQLKAGHKDIILADGLTDGPHNLSIYVNNSATVYWAIVGFYQAQITPKILTFDYWNITTSQAVSAGLPPIQFGYANTGTKILKNVVLSMSGSNWTDGNGNLLSSNVGTSGLLDLNTYSSINIIRPLVTNNITASYVDYNINISANYPDITGSIIGVDTIKKSITSPDWTLTGTGWNLDQDLGEDRGFTNAYTNYATISVIGPSATIRVEQDFGWGDFVAYVDNISAAIITCNNASRVYVDKPVYVGNGSHILKIKKKDNNAKYIAISSVSYNTSANYSNVIENQTIRFNIKQPLPTKLNSSISISGQKFNYDFITKDRIYYDAYNNVLRSDYNLKNIETWTRFPNYAVCYQSGFRDILSTYDVLIIDPFAVSSIDVEYWKNLGIKLYGYISYGEEDGVNINEYDSDSAQGPYQGDKAGPGGYASYYVKGGYDSRESTECARDRQALESIKQCTLSMPNYRTSVGRCTCACRVDNISGYGVWSSGGSCAKGHNKNNYYQRDALNGCSTSNCPDYYPWHKVATASGCPNYLKNDGGWLQDFSIQTTNIPDENGIWASFYTRPVSSWDQRLKSFYLPTVLGQPVSCIDEIHTAIPLTISTGAIYGWKINNAPVDINYPVTVQYLSGGTWLPLEQQIDYTFIDKTGNFIAPTTIAGLISGGQIKTSYTRKGLNLDGVFMDTVDTVDVYPNLNTFQLPFADLINNHKETYPNKNFISNRGFTILPHIIKSCSGVMFESFISSYNFDTAQYYEITDPDSIAYNNEILQDLIELRKKYLFDVYALNYCDNNSSGDHLRQIIAEKSRKYGFLSWSTTILLNQPLTSDITDSIQTPNAPIKNTTWRRHNVKSIS